MSKFKIRFDNGDIKVFAGSQSLNLYKDKGKVEPLVGPELYEALKASNGYKKNERKIGYE